MIPCIAQPQRNTPPRQISCPLEVSHAESRLSTGATTKCAASDIGWLDYGIGHALVDYREFKATVELDKDVSCAHKCNIQKELRTASRHEKRLAFLKERERQNQEKRGSIQNSVASTRASLLDLVPPSAGTNADAKYVVSTEVPSETEDEDSQIIFSLKVTQPSRLIRRRTARLGIISCNSKTTVAAANYYHHNTSNNNNNANPLGASYNSNASFFDDSFSFLFPPQKETISPVGDFSQTCSPNHDSFQTSANLSTMPEFNDSQPPVNPVQSLQKKRKSMMNWLANRKSTRNLMASPDKDPSPPTFVKVIYLGNQTTTSSQELKLQSFNPALTNNQPLDSSYHKRVASSMA